MSDPFRPEIMKDLTPTSIPGAYTSPVPPPDFDPNTADAATLIKHGIHEERPGPDADPAAKALWNARYPHDYASGTWLVPEQVPNPRNTRHSRLRSTEDGNANSYTNWGGCILSGTWNACSASLTVPTVSKPNEIAGIDGQWDTSIWVGLDGSGTNDILQTGVEASVDANGNAHYVAWYEWFCTVQKQTLGDSSDIRPAMASLGNILCMAWIGRGNNLLNVITSTDRGQTWPQKYVSSQTSPASPALCVHNGKIYIAWTGTGNGLLNVSQVTFDGNGNATSITQPVLVGGNTSTQGPSLASVGGNLYIAWTGNGNDKINIAVSTNDGASFVEPPHVSSMTTPCTPALCALGLRLFVAWKGDGNDQLNVADCTFSGPSVTSLTNIKVLGDTSPLAPSLAAIGNTLYLAWRSNGSDTLNIMYSTDTGNTFGGKYVSSETSSDAPALAAYGSDLFIAWRGDGNTNLNASLVGIVNGTINGFTTPKYLIQTNISNLPVKAGDTLSLQVQYSADKSRGIVSIQNVTQKTKLTPITLVPPPGAQMLGQTAEWILEALQLNVGTQSQYAHIPAFTLTKFTNASASLTGSPTVGNPINATIVAVENDEQLDLTLTSRGNQTVTISYVPQSQSHVVSATELETAASVS